LEYPCLVKPSRETGVAFFVYTGIHVAGTDITEKDFQPLDILVYAPSEIAKDKERKFTFIHDVFKSGKILYAIK
jgi:hypothetical protein